MDRQETSRQLIISWQMNKYGWLISYIVIIKEVNDISTFEQKIISIIPILNALSLSVDF